MGAGYDDGEQHRNVLLGSVTDNQRIAQVWSGVLVSGVPTLVSVATFVFHTKGRSFYAPSVLVFLLIESRLFSAPPRIEGRNSVHCFGIVRDPSQPARRTRRHARQCGSGVHFSRSP